MIADYILIIGAMKSGTTTLFDQLALDPRIAGATPKEPGFFAFEEVHSMGWDWYEELFGFDPDRHTYALDGSTDYTKAPFVSDVEARIETARAEGRQFKLIYIIREPVSRLVSHARHTQLNSKEVGQFISPRKRHDLDAPNGLSPVNLAVSDYAAQLEPYADFQDRGELFVTTLDAISSNGQGVMDSLSEFLSLPGLRWHKEANQSNGKEDQRAPNPLLTAAADIPAAVGLVKTILPKSVREAIKNAAKRPVETPGRFALTDDERATLKARYADSLEVIQTRYGVVVPSEWRTR